MRPARAVGDGSRGGLAKTIWHERFPPSFEEYAMRAALNVLLDRFESGTLHGSKVIPWSSPVPVFGSAAASRVATLGLNPSNREFVDARGNELVGTTRRFPTLRSLGIPSWSSATGEHVQAIIDACDEYFVRNPYDGWFKKLDFVISSTDASYYDRERMACHLDLIPFATSCKWTELDRKQRASLMTLTGNTLALVLRDSTIRVLILNGASVISHFESLAGVELERRSREDWTLPRRGGAGVCGVAYSGTVRAVAGVELSRDVLVLGFNHNLQSSFGVTGAVTRAIQTWVGRAARAALQ